MRERLDILVYLPAHSAYQRGIIAGAARFCRENPEVRLRFPEPEWDLIDSTAPVDGVIAAVWDAETERHARRYGTPVVNISAISSIFPFPSVIIDGRGVGAMGAEHLLNQGYEHFACHFGSRTYFSHQRMEGFCERLGQAGNACELFDTDCPSRVDRSPASLRAATAQWLGGLPKPLGLFTHNDIRGAMLLDVCREANLVVPEQIGVVSVDNDELLDSLLVPTLTSIDPAADVIGYRAASLVRDMLRGEPAPPQPILIPPRQVIQRQSTQPVITGDESLARAISFIRENAHRPISVKEAAEEGLLSRRVLERRFRQRLGRSPSNEIRRVKIERAKSLLTTSNINLKQIAGAVGYREYRNFATAFRREVGLSPGEYRRQLRKC
jgi:LacI family transcriptional regulator